VVLAFRRGSEEERAFWQRTLERGEAAEDDLEQAIALMAKHRAIEDTVSRARHYGAIAKDALALFPAAPMSRPWRMRWSFPSTGRIDRHGRTWSGHPRLTRSEERRGCPRQARA